MKSLNDKQRSLLRSIRMRLKELNYDIIIALLLFLIHVYLLQVRIRSLSRAHTDPDNDIISICMDIFGLVMHSTIANILSSNPSPLPLPSLNAGLMQSY